MSTKTEQKQPVTVEMAFYRPATVDGLAMSIQAGITAAGMLEEATTLLDGAWLLQRRMADEETDVPYLEAKAIAFVVESASAMVQAAKRGMNHSKE